MKHLSPHNYVIIYVSYLLIFIGFTENCSILKADTDAIKASRLVLSKMSADVLRIGLDLLGIDVIDVMMKIIFLFGIF